MTRIEHAMISSRSVIPASEVRRDVLCCFRFNVIPLFSNWCAYDILTAFATFSIPRQLAGCYAVASPQYPKTHSALPSDWLTPRQPIALSKRWVELNNDVPGTQENHKANENRNPPVRFSSSRDEGHSWPPPAEETK
jgi:hypothetical protein